MILPHASMGGWGADRRHSVGLRNGLRQGLDTTALEEMSCSGYPAFSATGSQQVLVEGQHADGSFVYKMTRKQHDVQALQQDLQAWEKILKMPFNPTKCEVIRITWKRAPVNTTYLIHDHPPQLVKQKKYLGVILSDKYPGPHTLR